MKTLSSYLQIQFQTSPFRSFLVSGIFFFGLGFGSYFIAEHRPLFFSQTLVSASSVPTRLSQTQYSLINPLLLCNVERIDNSLNTDLQKKIADFIKERIAKGTMSDMSVYLQQYGVGKWVGVNENERYDPASLLKVPLMIAYYQVAEKTPSLLKESISFRGEDQNMDEYFKSPNNIKSGNFYTIEQLIDSMIVNSDNTAMTLLSNYIDKNSLYTVYTDLGLPTPPDDPTVEYISAKSYAYFFRILYNATYLNRADSQKALELLAENHLPNGIASAVPVSMTMADKFGERTFVNSEGTVISRELHDCGIVYTKSSPYLLCVMSKGKDFDELAQNIHDLSSLVYSNVTK